MPDLDLESDQFLELLTDALLAGPGSPKWHQAITQLGAQGSKAQQYKILIAAREYLESGKAYRTVRPGPEFTREILARIQTSTFKRPLLRANLIALLCAALGLIVIVGLLLLFTPADDPTKAAVDELANIYFTTTILATTFPSSLNPQWRDIGQLKLDASKQARHPAWVLPPTPGTKDAGGGIVAATPIAANQPLVFEVALRVWGASPNTVAQVFLTDEPQFSSDRGTTPHELVWFLQNNLAKVAIPSPQPRIAGARKIAPSPDPILVRITLNRDVAIIESVGNRLWAGQHHLDPAKPRYLGVRFIRRDTDKSDPLGLCSIKLLTP
jgi:hypothetical protein